MEPERLFSWRWHPYEIDPAARLLEGADHAGRLHPRETGGGTRLTVVESGFDRCPRRRASALRLNDDGWTEQLENVERHVTAGPRG